MELEYSTSTGDTESYAPNGQINEDDAPFPIHALEDRIPSLDRIGPSEWLNLPTGEVLDLDGVIAEYGEQFQSFGLPAPKFSIPDWLREVRKSIPVHFIGTERLTLSSNRLPRNARSRRHYSEALPERTVRRYSQQLGQMVRQTLTEYATLSQSLDRTFPVRLVEESTIPALSMDVLGEKLAEVEKKRSNIVEAGLLVEEHQHLSLPPIDTVDESRRGVLAVYAEDALRKLSVFDHLYDRVITFKKIASARFLYKNVTVGAEGLKVLASDGSALELEMLSSGEQHELVLLYDLLFGVEKNSLIMIDEPELSLHVAWQRQMLSDLQDMARLSDFHVLLATHSPQIIGDRWDLAVELKGPDGR